jgi:ribosomal protein L44E
MNRTNTRLLKGRIDRPSFEPTGKNHPTKKIELKMRIISLPHLKALSS